jgi:hypothetical protein
LIRISLSNTHLNRDQLTDHDEKSTEQAGEYQCETNKTKAQVQEAIKVLSKIATNFLPRKLHHKILTIQVSEALIREPYISRGQNNKCGPHVALGAALRWTSHRREMHD